MSTRGQYQTYLNGRYVEIVDVKRKQDLRFIGRRGTVRDRRGKLVIEVPLNANGEGARLPISGLDAVIVEPLNG